MLNFEPILDNLHCTMKGIVLITLFFLSVVGDAQNIQQEVKNYNTDSGIALQGYDAVSYFNNKVKKGKEGFSFTHNGLTYYFSSESNKERFLQNPTKYMPQYGGWCAYAMGKSGEKVTVNPKSFKILDGKLYLFYNANFVNTLKKWNKNEENLKVAADKNWKKIIDLK